MKPQARDVLYLLRFKGDLGVTQQDAIRELSCYRLAARVADLKADGYFIRTQLATDSRGHRYARYVLEEREQLAAGL